VIEHAQADPRAPAAETGRITAQPDRPAASVATGVRPLGLARGRDALLYVPPTYRPGQPAPFVLALHGAGGEAYNGLVPLADLAEHAGLIVLSPSSRERTWDSILGGFGPDIEFLNRALEATFAQVAIDPERLAISGFSDGASYALSLGITNGDLFSHIIAFSPGFVAPAAQRGHPGIYISHGTRDRVLPIATCSRRIVPMLKHTGYEVLYHEFDGPHTVPPGVAQEAVTWFTTGRTPEIGFVPTQEI